MMRGLAVTILLFVGCVPLQSVGRDLVDTLTGDRATLRYCEGGESFAAPCLGAYGIAFDPADRPALAVILDVLGRDLTTNDARCEVVAAGLQCHLGDVAVPTAVSLTGQNVTATATYRRPGEGRIYQETAR